MGAVHSQAVGYAIMLGFFGLIMPGIDNYAHAGGFVGGYLVGQFMDPLRTERLDHLLIALGCLAASALAILASLVVGLPGRIVRELTDEEVAGLQTSADRYVAQWQRYERELGSPE